MYFNYLYFNYFTTLVVTALRYGVEIPWKVLEVILSCCTLLPLADSVIITARLWRCHNMHNMSVDVLQKRRLRRQQQRWSSPAIYSAGTSWRHWLPWRQLLQLACKASARELSCWTAVIIASVLQSQLLSISMQPILITPPLIGVLGRQVVVAKLIWLCILQV